MRNFKFMCFVNNFEPNMLHDEEIFAEITTSANNIWGEEFAQFITLGSICTIHDPWKYLYNL